MNKTKKITKPTKPTKPPGKKRPQLLIADDEGTVKTLLKEVTEGLVREQPYKVFSKKEVIMTALELLLKTLP